MKKQRHLRTILGALILSACFLVSGVLAGDSFTIAVIPDTQNYVDHTKPQPGSLDVFKAETGYLASQKDDLNLVFVTHVGDVVQHGDGTNGTPGNNSYGGSAEWDRAKEAMEILAATGVAFGLSPGNHDYDNYSYTAANGNRPLKSQVMWKEYFGSGSSFFAGMPWYGGASDALACSPGLSSYQTFIAGGKPFLHISLEMEAGDSALAWAQSVIDTHRGYATIITTHSFLNPPDDSDNRPPLAVPTGRTTAACLNNSPGGWNSAQAVWEKLIAPNDQVFMVLCGHTWGATVRGVSKAQNLRVDNNQFGHAVYQVLSDYQGNTLGVDGTIGADPGGDGWLRLMEFDLENRTIHFITYSPKLNRHAGQNGENTFNQLPAFSDFTLPMPTQVLDAFRDVTSQIRTTAAGFLYSRTSRLYTGRLTLTNSGSDLTGTIDVVLNGLPSGVTLANAAGSINGTPTITATTGGLDSGSSITIPLQFSNPANVKIAFTPIILQK